jgi:hypothetical protein
MRHSNKWLGIAALALLVLGAATASFAAGPDDAARAGARGGGPRGEVLDGRYNHGHYYPPAGAVVRGLPGGYRPYYYHGSRFYFSGGVWYAPGPYGFVVTRPPVGLFVTVLPPFYTTVWFGGIPYYYADNVYYQWQPDANGYAIVDAPPGADQPGPPPGAPAGGPPGAAPGAAPGDDFFIYPKNGQTPEQQAADQYECHSWSKTQTGFDPTQPGGGVAPGDSGSRREQYRRAMTACLEARGYSVK